MLVLAWALGSAVKDVQTGEYLAGALEAGIPYYMLPALITVRTLSLLIEAVMATEFFFNARSRANVRPSLDLQSAASVACRESGGTQWAVFGLATSP